MIRIILQKMIHKKWMMLSLLIGNILLIATAVSHPMYREASLGRMLTEEFSGYQRETGENPTRLSMLGRMRKNESTAEYQRMEEMSKTLCKALGVEQELSVTHHRLIETSAESMVLKGAEKTQSKVYLGTMSDFLSHAEVMSGRIYADTLDSEGRIEAVVTVAGFVGMDLLVGEELELPYLKDAQGNPFHVIVTGVVSGQDGREDYWAEKPDSFVRELLISETLFHELFCNPEIERSYEYDTRWYVTFDYRKLSYKDVERILADTQMQQSLNTSMGKLDPPAYSEFLLTFLEKEKKIEVTLLILQLPVLLLLCSFLFMISRKLFEMEQGEISLMKSRGASGKQIVGLYFLQSLALAIVSFAAGLPLGELLCRVLGSASAFMTFVSRKPLQISFTPEVFIYALVAILVSILMTLLPVLRQSEVTIVKQKQNKARHKQPLWKKLFLDVILMGIALYGYFSFHRQREAIEAEVLSGADLDPLLFLSSSLFILGAALLCLRLWPLLIRLLYRIGRKRWGVAAYTSFLEILRTGERLYFIMTFLMLTVGLGIFSATVARTIDENAQENLKYRIGADLVMQEKWKDNSIARRMDPTLPLVYIEPDYAKYGQIDGVKSMARVYRNDQVTLSKELAGENVTVLGIHTKNFGEATWLPEDLLEKHYYTYLNELSVDADNILVSSSFRDVLGYHIGDTLNYSNGEAIITGKIIDFVDYFPTFEQKKTYLLPDGTSTSRDRFLIVAHLSTIQKNWGVTPYQIWFSFASPEGRENFYAFLEKENITLTQCEDTTLELTAIKRDTLFEGTNGILTMSFIIILILCSIGYLIYWILSIRSRELMFGVFRAMGVSRGEVIRMLIYEQLFSSFLSIGCGAGIGIAAAHLFVPMIQTAYAAASQLLPMSLITRGSDMLQLFEIIGCMLLVCFAVLIRQVLKLKIAQALKLGEE